MRLVLDSQYLMEWLLITLVVSLLLLLMTLLVLLFRATREMTVLQRLEVKRLTHQNQSLLNQLRAQDLNHLAGLQTLTQVQSLSSEPQEVILNDDILGEEELAAQGFSLGDVTDDFAANGYGSVPYSLGEDGTITAYDRYGTA